MQKTISFKKKIIVSAMASALAGMSVTALAQDTDAVEEIVVSGIRASLQKSMDIKRDAAGVVDVISAEDIGKMPDTNLAESLQRVPGVSIDRAGGEGQKITVRGIGPEHNLVTFNGRTVARTTGDRSFDFSNIAAEMVSSVSVAKTTNATLDSGGMGSTVNIGTARPLNSPGQKVVLKAQGIADQSTDTGAGVTPEVFGLYSNTFADDTIGVSASVSYQKRESGDSSATVGTGWRSFDGIQDQDWSGANATWGGVPKDNQQINRPSDDEIYSVPQTTVYTFNEAQRERTNGQLVLQWKPTDSLKATLDVDAYSRTVETQKHDVSAWFGFPPSKNVWTDGPVSSPLIYSETYGSAPNYSPTDLSMAAGGDSNKYTGSAVGLNLAWDVTDSFTATLDVSTSTAERKPNSKLGSATTLSTAAMIRTSATTDFTGDIPALIVGAHGKGAGATGNAVTPNDMILTGSVIGNSQDKSDVDQVKLGGHFAFDESNSVDFGLSTSKIKNRNQSTNVQRNDWGGVSAPGALTGIYTGTEDSVSSHFDGSFGSFGTASQLNGGAFAGDGTALVSANIQDKFFQADYKELQALARKNYEYTGLQATYDAGGLVGNCGDGLSMYCPSSDWDRGNDVIVEEKTKAFYVQENFKADVGSMPLDMHIGARYEATEVDSASATVTYNQAVWIADTEIALTPTGKREYLTQNGDYHYFLPNVDVSLEVIENLKVRTSLNQSIGRANYNDLRGGLSIGNLANAAGGSGNTGNAALKPLEATNFDLSVEWYFADTSYASVGYFNKKIDNYVTTEVVDTTIPGIYNPTLGGYANAARAANQTSNPTIRAWVKANRAGSPGVTNTGAGIVQIAGIAGDPLMNFQISTPTNGTQERTIHGMEFAVQHVFGESGFGASANYTKVDSDLTYDNFDLNLINNQQALVGLSDSYNIIGFYEKYGVNARLAYNYRDEFLNSTGQGTGRNPQYTEGFGQFDLNVSYELPMVEGLAVFLQGINITDEHNRTHGRSKTEVLSYTETGARYVIGASYKF